MNIIELRLEVVDEREDLRLIDTSSAETGSSAMMRSGFNTSARASAIRCFWPPENSWGYRS